MTQFSSLFWASNQPCCLLQCSGTTLRVRLRCPFIFFVVPTCWEIYFSSRRYSTYFFFFFSWIIIPAILPADDARILLYECILNALWNFFIIISIYRKLTSHRASLDRSSFGKTSNRSAAKSICSFLFWSTCMLFDLSIAYDFIVTFLRSLCLHLARGLVRHGYPWVPTDQAHGCPRQVGPTYQKIRPPIKWPQTT
jgi:hypothetical protein